jgi:hypothetical protein
MNGFFDVLQPLFNALQIGGVFFYKALKRIGDANWLPGHASFPGRAS